MPVNLLDAVKSQKRGVKVLSPKRAAKFIGISPGLFYTEERAGTLQPQAIIESDSDKGKDATGYAAGYLKEIKAVIPNTPRTGSRRLFTPEIKEQIKKINKRWPTQ